MKRYRIFIVIIFWTTALCGYGQANQIDSLKTILTKVIHDTVRLAAIDAIIESESNIDSIERYSLAMKNLSQKNINNEKQIVSKLYQHYYAISLNNLAYVEENKGDIKRADSLYQSSLAIFETIEDKEGQAMALNNLGYLHKINGRINLALDFYERCLQLRLETNDKKGLAIAQSNLGQVHFSLGDMVKALEYYRSALSLQQEIGNKGGEVSALINIAGVYFNQGEFDTSIDYVKKCVETAKESGNLGQLARALDRLGQTYVTTKEYPKALESYQESLTISQKINNKDFISTAIQGMGNVYNNTNRPDQALKLFQQALALNREINQKIKVARNLNAIGTVYEKKENPKEAINYYQQSLALSNAMGYPEEIQIAAENLSRVYKQNGNSSKALDMFELSVQMRDSISNEYTRKNALKSQYKYEYEKKAVVDSLRSIQEKSLLTAQLSQATTQRYLLLTGLALLVVIALSVVYRIYSKQKIGELNFRNKIASDLHDDVGSALTSISIFSEVATQKLQTNTEDARLVIDKIGSTSRTILEDMGDIVWAISPRNDSIKTLTDRMHTFGQALLTEINIRFQLNIDEKIKNVKLTMDQRKNIYLIFKEAVNNSAKYSQATTVAVSLQIHAGAFEMKISDDGVGFEGQKIKKGNGLDNMAERASEIKAKLDITSAPGKGTELHLTVKPT